jgi:hypothetical protein
VPVAGIAALSFRPPSRLVAFLAVPLSRNSVVNSMVYVGTRSYDEPIDRPPPSM